MRNNQLITAAESYGTPSYVYFEEIIRNKCRILNKLFPALPVKWLYAVKANDNPHILNIILNEGLGFDTVSFEEALLCLKVGAKPEDIFYTENNMTDAEMHAAVKNKVVLNIGSISRFRAFCKAYPGKECSLRLKPDIGDGHHAKVDTGNKDSKFGIRLDRIPEIVELAKKRNVKVSGIHAHIGSGIRKPENLLHEIAVLLDIAAQFEDLKSINFGGGIPIPYQPDEREFDLTTFAAMASEYLEAYAETNKQVVFLFEPGRWIVGHAGALVTQVNTVKNQGTKKFIGTDTGFNHLLRPALYDAYHSITNLSAEGRDQNELYDVAGNICESGDILGYDRKIPVTEPGDFLAILDSGAYGMTMASHYNRRSLPAEVLVTSEGELRLIRKRKSAEETVLDYLKETNYKSDAKSQDYD